jgi:hypothetical protein
MKKTIIISLIIFILTAATVSLSVMLINQIAEKKRLKDNLKVEISGDHSLQQNLTTAELKEFFPQEIQSLKKFDVKPGYIENIVKVKYNYIDSICIKDTLIYHYDTVRQTLRADFSLQANCTSINGYVENNTIVTERISTTDTLLICLFKEKRQCLFKPRLVKAIAISGCNGDTLTILRNIKISD